MLKQRTRSKIKTSEYLLLGVFLLSVVLSIFTLYSTSEHLLDSDASAEMVLAHHLHETGGVLSTDWFYSTEIRAVYMQLILAPLFGLFESWHMVRFVGAAIWQAIYVASFGFLMYQAGMKRKAFYLGASMLLLPVSVSYGRIVLYHQYYIVNFILGFLLTGLLLACVKNAQSKRWGWLAVQTALFLAASFLGGLNGYRQIAITHAPLALMAVIWLYQSRNGKSGAEAFGMLALIGAGVLAAGAGMLVNSGWHSTYSFRDYTVLQLKVMPADQVMDMLFGLFHQFGFRRDIGLMSRMGLLSVASLVVALYCMWYGSRAVISREERPLGHRLIACMLPCSLAVVVLVFVFTIQNTWAELYFLPYVVWFVPLLCLAATEAPDYPEKNRLPAWLTGRKLVVYALCGICMLNGLSNMQSFSNVRGFNQRYEALKMDQPEYAVYLTDVVGYLVDEGYDMGYSEFWDTSILTEMSDGKLPMINIYEELPHEYRYYDWLSLKSYRDAPAEKPFLLIKHDRLGMIDHEALSSILSRKHQIGAYVIYDITDVEAWKAYLAQ